MKYSVDYVKNYYEDWTQRYIESFGDTFQSRRIEDKDQYAQYILEAAGVKDGMNIVDAGCGIAGPAIDMVNNKDIHVDGVTISEEQAQIARQKIADAGVEDKVQVYAADFHEMDQGILEGPYDGIIYLESFVHSDDPERAIDAALNLLKPGGFVYIKDLFHGTATDPQQAQVIDKVIQNANKYCAMNVKKLSDFIAIVEQKPVAINYIREIGFESDTDFANQFIIRNGIPLNESVSADIFNLKFLDYYEIRLTKLAS